MKHATFFFILLLTTVLSVSCSKSSSKKSKNNAYCQQNPFANGCANANPYCVSNPTAPGCGTNGYTTGTTTGGSVNCFPPASTSQSSCPNYCQFFPGTSGCLANGTNCKTSPTFPGCPKTTTTSPSYGALYPQFPNGVPDSGGCSVATIPANNPYAYETWKGLMTVVGSGRTSTPGYDPMRGIYNPEFGAGYYTNTDPTLTSVTDVQSYFMTDSTLKVRFKVKPQPTTAGLPGCFNRNTGLSASYAGYTRLQFNVSLKGIRPDGSHTAAIPLGTVAPTGLNSCTPAFNLQTYKLQYPDGIFLIVDNVTSNQDCNSAPGLTPTTGYTSCQAFAPVRSADCWSLEMEVATDTTKTFN
jgi:hypothetical protein